jgi:hypothetical protein
LLSAALPKQPPNAPFWPSLGIIDTRFLDRAPHESKPAAPIGTAGNAVMVGSRRTAATASAYVDLAPTLAKVVSDSKKIVMVEVVDFDRAKRQPRHRLVMTDACYPILPISDLSRFQSPQSCIRILLENGGRRRSAPSYIPAGLHVRGAAALEALPHGPIVFASRPASSGSST